MADSKHRFKLQDHNIILSIPTLITPPLTDGMQGLTLRVHIPGPVTKAAPTGPLLIVRVD